MAEFPRVAKLKTADSFSSHIQNLPIPLPFAEKVTSGSNSPLAGTLDVYGKRIGNRFCILPMEGWDGTPDGNPTEFTIRRWRRFGASGAKLIWGGEAVAVCQEGRANPNQLMIAESNLGGLETLRTTLVEEHQEKFGDTTNLSIGLQLTHSGRFARPNDKAKLEPRTAYRHPILDEKFNVDHEQAMLTDDEISKLIDDFVAAAVNAERVGFEWVDIKHCHGYLGHELLSGYDREGKYGGSFENRTRFLSEIVSGIRAKTKLELGVRLSIFDFVPFTSGEDKKGQPALSEYSYAFGSDASGVAIDFDEPKKFLQLMLDLGIKLLCTTAGSPYYVPHIQRPAVFPPSDGYLPPEDPLVGVARQIQATGQLKKFFPDLTIVGSGYSYLQDWLPNVAEAAVRDGLVDSVGLGRMVLSYPELPADVLSGNELARKRICRTFSDCTTAARHGMISGCYPLDDHYKNLPEFKQLVQLKKQSLPSNK